MITSSSLPFNSSLGYPVPACLHFEYGHRLLPPEINQSINQLVSLAKTYSAFRLSGQSEGRKIPTTANEN